LIGVFEIRLSAHGVRSGSGGFRTARWMLHKGISVQNLRLLGNVPAVVYERVILCLRLRSKWRQFIYSVVLGYRRVADAINFRRPLHGFNFYSQILTRRLV